VPGGPSKRRCAARRIAKRSSTGASGARNRGARPAAARDLRDDEARGQAGLIGRRSGADARDGGSPVDHANGQPGIAGLSGRRAAEGALARLLVVVSSAPGPTISMCDWPSSPIIWLATR
jgi:hypothetical protein